MAKTTKKVSEDDFADILSKAVNAANKDMGTVAYSLDNEQDDPSHIVDWISTGCTELDLAISNRPNGGFPVGRLCEMSGLEGSGKSLVSAHVLAETQKKGGLAVYFDVEKSISREFLEAIGVQTEGKNKLLVLNSDTVEEIFNNLELMVSKIRASSKDKLVTFVIDSISAASCETEIASEHGKDGYNTSKAIILSKAMRKIGGLIATQRILVVVVSQLREKMNAMAFGDKYTTPGGKSIPFHSSVRLRLASTGKIKSGDNIVGNTVQAKVVKNRMGPPHKIANFNLYYDRGIDDASSWIDTLKKHKIVDKAYTVDQKKKKNLTDDDFKTVAKGQSSKFMYTANDGSLYEFNNDNFITDIYTNKEIRDEIYQKLCDVYIMKYRKANSIIDDDFEVIEDNGEE